MVPGDPSEDTPYGRRVLELLATDDAIVPEIWAFEVANSIFVSFKKRHRITERQIEEYLLSRSRASRECSPGDNRCPAQENGPG
jgi:hypothetical protein